MQNLWLKLKKNEKNVEKQIWFFLIFGTNWKRQFCVFNFFDNKSKKYHKTKCDTSLKSYDHAEFKSGTWKQILQPILPCKILG